MSVGNRKAVVRLEAELWKLVEDEVRRSAADPLRPPHTVSSWIRQACLDKLRHADRSRGAKRPSLRALRSSPKDADSR